MERDFVDKEGCHDVGHGFEVGSVFRGSYLNVLILVVYIYIYSNYTLLTQN